MKIKQLSVFLIMVVTVTVNAGELQNTQITVSPIDRDNGFNCERGAGYSKANHEIGCTISLSDGLESGQTYPIIVWPNGWEQSNVPGRCVAGGYLPRLKEWAAEEPFFVAVANAWSAREPECLA